MNPTISDTAPTEDGRMCLKEDSSLCLGLSLPEDLVTTNLPVQIKHWGKNAVKNLTVLKLEWHQDAATHRFKPLTSQTLCVSVKENEAIVTLDIGSLKHLDETISVSMEGRRYRITETRPFGFSVRRYILVKLQEINEKDTSTGKDHG